MIKKIIHSYPKYKIELLIPKEIELFIQATHLNKKEILNKSLISMEVEDNIFYSHEKHPAEKDYASFFKEPLSKSKKIKVLIYGIYINTKQIFELNPKDLVKKEPLTTASTNSEKGIRIYFAFYD